MDHTQTGQSNNFSDDQVFFTAGAGVDLKDEKNIDPENNLDTTSSAWGNNLERDSRNIGSSALFSSAEAPSTSILKNDLAKGQRLDQIVRVEMPPGAEPEVETPNSDPELKTPSFSKQDFIAGDKITANGLNLVNSEENKLAKDGDIASFYDFISKAKEAIRSGKEVA